MGWGIRTSSERDALIINATSPTSTIDKVRRRAIRPIIFSNTETIRSRGMVCKRNSPEWCENRDLINSFSLKQKLLSQRDRDDAH